PGRGDAGDGRAGPQAGGGEPALRRRGGPRRRPTRRRRAHQSEGAPRRRLRGQGRGAGRRDPGGSGPVGPFRAGPRRRRALRERPPRPLSVTEGGEADLSQGAHSSTVRPTTFNAPPSEEESTSQRFQSSPSYWGSSPGSNTVTKGNPARSVGTANSTGRPLGPSTASFTYTSRFGSSKAAASRRATASANVRGRISWLSGSRAGEPHR